MIPVLERFLNKISVVENGCWIWPKTLYDGYGRMNINGKTIGAHRFIYEYYYGKIDRMLVIDHLCRNRACVNINHLEVVTNAENTKRGLTGKINNYNAKKTRCPKGHEFTPENTYRRKNGWRVCKKCSSNWV